MLLKKIQQQFEAIYRLPPLLSIEDFLISQETLEQLAAQKQNLPLTRRGMMLLLPERDEMRVAIYLHNQVMDNLYTYNPFIGLNENNIQAFCIAVEEVSHFLYTTWKVQQSLPITTLELELQAEVDTFILCTLYHLSHGSAIFCSSLMEFLFDSFHVAHDLPSESQHRYSTANTLVRHYCYFLDDRFIKKSLFPLMMAEIRKFYRLGQTDKISHINRTVFYH
jgi:hypothetical protein